MHKSIYMLSSGDPGTSDLLPQPNSESRLHHPVAWSQLQNKQSGEGLSSLPHTVVLSQLIPREPVGTKPCKPGPLLCAMVRLYREDQNVLSKELC